MLALKNMQVPDIDMPLSDITNSTNPQSMQDFERIHAQMKDLTGIANALQREMAALSKRSRDNATDLMALKKATSNRDEEIKKSLQALVNGKKGSEQGLLMAPKSDVSRPQSSLSMHQSVFDHKPFYAQPPQKSSSMPRIPTVHDVESHHESTRAASPSPFSVDSTSSMAMLEKIIREMVTKEGQDQLLSSLSDLINKSTKESSDVLKRVIEIVESVRDSSTSQALVRHRTHGRQSGGSSRVTSIDDASERSERALTRRDQIPSSVTAPPQSQPAVVSEELLGLLKKIKDSVSQSGGLTGEVKSIIRELRGEVLGMGRELGRKMDQIEVPEKITRDSQEAMASQEVARVVQEGLEELKDSMHSVIQSRRRDSMGSLASRNTVDNNEVYAVVKHALAEQQQYEQSQRLEPAGAMDRDSILIAVKEAFEAYKPEIELQQFGLERDEILQCLKEGLEDYQSSRSSQDQPSISREEVMGAIQDALQSFTPPQPPSEVSEIKQEVMVAVQECLENFRPPVAENVDPRAAEAHRDEVLDAVRDGIGAIRREEARQIEISPDDLLQAVQTGLQSMDNPFGAYGSQVLNSLHEIVEGMRVEFKQYSEANGRDTEQVLDAMKDGLESLRGEIETYVDRAQDVTGKDEIIETLRTELDALRSAFDSFAVQQGQNDKVGDRSDLANWMKAEFENLHEIIVSNTPSNDSSQDKQRLIDALDSGFSELRSNLGSRGVEEPSEEHLEALKEEFEQLREAVLNGSASHKDEVLDSLQESFSNLHVRMSSMSGNSGNSEELLSAVREEISSLRDSMQAPVLHSGPSSSSNEETITAIKESMESIRVQLAADQNESSSETLGAIREELENLREAINGSLMLGATGTDKEAIIEAVKAGFADANLPSSDNIHEDRTAEALEMIKEEVEHLRQSIGSAVVHGGPHSGDEEVLEVLRSGLDELKSSLGSQLAYPAQLSGVSGDALDSLHDNLNSLRADIGRMHDKPVDMTVSYEILDTLKEGLSNLREDLDRMKSGQNERDVVLADSEMAREADGSRQSGNVDAPSRADIERLEVMLAQLQIKIEALDQNIGAQPYAQPNPNAAVKEDLVGIESMIRGVQSDVAGLAARESQQQSPAASNGIAREDVDALETLLQNTKARIEETVIPSLENTITRENLDTVEAIVRMTQEAVESISARFDGDHSAKNDIEALALLVHDTSTAVNDIREKLGTFESEDQPTKSDLAGLRDVCDEIKVKLDDVPNGMPSQADIGELGEMLTELRDAQQTLKDKYEADVGITAKAFDDRKDESTKILDSVDDLRGAIEETRDHLKSRIKRGNEDVRILDEILQGIEEKIDDIPSSFPSLDEFKAAVQEEFEKANGAIESIRNDHESRCATILEKAEEHQAAVIGEIVTKLDQCFDEIKERHDEQQQVIGEATLTMTEKQKQQDELLSGSKAMSEELKVTIDTFGSTVQGISPALQEATEKWGDDARTVFNKVDQMSGKLEETHVDSKTNHQLTRDEVAKTMSAIGSVQNVLSANHPQVMEALNTLKTAVEQHFEHVRSSNTASEKLSDGLKAHFDEGLKRLPVPQIEAPRAETITTVDDKIHSKLDEILDKGASTPYDDAKVHSKLDELLGHIASSNHAVTYSTGLEELQKQFTTTTSEISAFVAFQTKMLAAEHDNKEKEADQAALDLSKCLNEKESLESENSSLRESKSSLNREVEILRSERDELAKQKLHLTADVSSLETALKLRREELTMMDARADALERRIIEGVMDHSRALLLAKAPRAGTPANMNLKRVSSNASQATTQSQATNAGGRTTTPSVVNTATDMALRARVQRSKTSSQARRESTNSPGGRRIVSLSQINNNVPAGGRHLAVTGERKMATGGGLGGGMKRSHSVRTQKTRKTSWQPGAGSLQQIGDDKENDLSMSDDSEGEREDGEATPLALTLANAPLSESIASRTTSISRSRSNTADTGAQSAVSQATSVSRPRTDTLTSKGTGAGTASRQTSISRPRTSTLTSRGTGTMSRQTSVSRASPSELTTTANDEAGSRRESYSTVVTGTNMTPSEYSYASSYFPEGSVVTNTPSDVTASTDRRRSRGSSLYSNAGSRVYSAEDGEVGEDAAMSAVASAVGVRHETADEEDEEETLRLTAPPPIEAAEKRRQPQREAGPGGYDSGLGSDLPTAQLGSVSDYFDQGESSIGGVKDHGMESVVD